MLVHEAPEQTDELNSCCKLCPTAHHRHTELQERQRTPAAVAQEAQARPPCEQGCVVNPELAQQLKGPRIMQGLCWGSASTCLQGHWQKHDQDFAAASTDSNALGPPSSLCAHISTRASASTRPCVYTSHFNLLLDVQLRPARRLLRDLALPRRKGLHGAGCSAMPFAKTQAGASHKSHTTQATG